LGLGAWIGARHVGGFGHAACLSFHPRKTITTGEGGMVLTDDPDLASVVGELRNYGASVQPWDRPQTDISVLPEYHRIGFNYKLTDLQAAIGLVQMRRLPTILAARREIASRYEAGLADLTWLRLPRPIHGQTLGWQSFVVMCGGEDG